MTPKVYGLLKQNLSKYLLAVTVDDPASAPPPTASGTKNPEAKAAEDGGAKATTTGASDEKSGAVGAIPAEEGDGTEKPSREKTGENGDGGGEPAEKTAAATTKASTGTPAAVKKADPNGPKCVQLKMKPDWRRVDGGNKRRRGDLDRSGGGGGRGGGGRRWAWPEGRPEFCRFVLYKENSDTVSCV